MDKALKINSDKAERAMTMYLLGEPGGLIPLYTEDQAAYEYYSIDAELYLSFKHKTLTVFIDTILSNIETKDLWLITYLMKVE